MYGPHITILVLNVVPHLNSMVYSKFPASRASVNNCGVVQDDRLLSSTSGRERDMSFLKKSAYPRGAQNGFHRPPRVAVGLRGSKVTDQGLSGF